jgi:hypothetical protein
MAVRYQTKRSSRHHYKIKNVTFGLHSIPCKQTITFAKYVFLITYRIKGF